MPEIELIELMPDETMVTAEGRVGRTLAMSAIDRAYYGREGQPGWLSPRQYRMAQCLNRDWEAIQRVGGGGQLGRCGDVFVALPRGTGSHANDAAIDAQTRIKDCERAVGAAVAYGMLEDFVRHGYSYKAIAKRWKRAHETAKATLQDALDRIAENDGPYERLQWSKSRIWAAA